MQRTRPMARVRRSRAEFARIYHSDDRVQWVQRQRCAVPGCLLMRSENAHSVNGGVGRKAGYLNILPLCAAHHHALDRTGGRAAFEQKYGLILAEAAARCQTAWLAYLAQYNDAPAVAQEPTK